MQGAPGLAIGHPRIQGHCAALPLHMQALPPAARMQADGGIVLSLLAPVTVALPGPAGGAAQPQQLAELVFRRLRGADLLRAEAARSPGGMLIALSLGLSPVAADRLLNALAPEDLAAIKPIISALAGIGDEPPGYATPGADGAIILPLLYPASDGMQSYTELALRPLTRAQIQATPRNDRWLSSAIHFATRIPIERARRLVSVMDGADIGATVRIIGAAGINRAGQPSPVVQSSRG